MIVTVFGSSRTQESDPDYQIAYELGQELARAGMSVCNGGYSGVMEASAKGAQENGGDAIGIMSSSYSKNANNWITEVRKTGSWRERLFELIDLADGYVVCNGGTGTLVEYLTVWEMAAKQSTQKPIIILGSKIKELTDYLERDPEISLDKNMRFASTPQEAVGLLKENLLSKEDV